MIGQATWTPIRVQGTGSAAVVDWCWTDGVTFDDPFFTQTIERCLREPFRLLFQRRTWLEQLGDLAPERRPSGFVFHLSRSGSTLVSQMLASMTGARVLSEPGPIENVLSMPVPWLDRAKKLRWLVSALGPDDPAAPVYVLKLDAWATLDFELFTHAFPGVPWVFCYRDPADVLVSQSAQRGYHMLPGTLPKERLNLSTTLPADLSLDEYGAAVLGRLLECAADAASATTHGLLVHYDQLPDAVTDGIASHLGIQLAPSDIQAMRDASTRDAKNPVLQYSDASRARKADANASMLAAVDRFAAKPYENLERMRGQNVART